MPLPVELRKRVVAAYHQNAGSIREVAAAFSVGAATLTRWLRLERNTGALAPRAPAGGRRSHLDEAGEQFLRRYLKQHPDKSLSELVEVLATEAGISTSQSGVRRTLARLRITKKKDLACQ